MNRRRAKLGATLAAGGIAITATAIALRPSPAPAFAAEIASNGAGMSIVKLPRGVLWASLEFAGTPGLTRLNQGEPVIDGRDNATVASAARPNTFVIWAFAEGPGAPIRLRYVDAGGQFHSVEIEAGG